MLHRTRAISAGQWFSRADRKATFQRIPADRATVDPTQKDCPARPVLLPLLRNLCKPEQKERSTAC
ncbi:hypothetical protein GCM10010359_23930 [Streptomyces morookaense]|nr:hypothetical protein GCM10010359_23930 [Streptomyces morookaense]